MKTFSSDMYDKYHLVRTHKFPKSYHFLPRYTHTYVCVSGDYKWQFFGMFCARTKWMSPVVKLINRSSREEVFLRKGVVKVCSKFTGEDPCRSVISINLLYNFIEITFWHGFSPINLLYIFRTRLDGCFCIKIFIIWHELDWCFLKC